MLLEQTRDTQRSRLWLDWHQKWQSAENTAEKTIFQILTHKLYFSMTSPFTRIQFNYWRIYYSKIYQFVVYFIIVFLVLTRFLERMITCNYWMKPFLANTNTNTNRCHQRAYPDEWSLYCSANIFLKALRDKHPGRSRCLDEASL